MNNEAQRYDEADPENLPEAMDNAEEAAEAVIAEQMTSLLDKVIRQGDVPAQGEHHLPDTEEVLHKVVEAAEHNQAIEKLFELSHEVKDLAASKQIHTSSATPISRLIESKGREYALPARSHAAAKPLTRLKMLMASNSLYGQAIRYGLVSAILALLTAVLAVTLFT